jgi:hypothetical protein
MPPLTLPARSPATIRAFWLIVSTGVGVVAGGGVATLKRDKRWWSLAAVVGAATAVPGLARPLDVDVAYRAWNRAGRELGSASSDFVSWVAFLALRSTRSLAARPAVELRSPGTSGWNPRTSQPPGSYPYQDAVPVAGGRDAFDRYVRQPDHEWAETLRPFVWLLGALETDVDIDDTPPSDIYTLY